MTTAERSSRLQASHSCPRAPNSGPMIRNTPSVPRTRTTSYLQAHQCLLADLHPVTHSDGTLVVGVLCHPFLSAFVYVLVDCFQLLKLCWVDLSHFECGSPFQNEFAGRPTEIPPQEAPNRIISIHCLPRNACTPDILFCV